MKSEDGVIIECTLDELKKKYIHEEYFTLMSWGAFLDSVKKQGAKIIDLDKE